MTLSKKRTNVARKQRERNEMCMKLKIHFWYWQDNPSFLTPNHIFLDFTSTYFPWSLASSRSWRNESFFSRSFRCFSRLSSSARSLTYCSNTCFLSLDVRSKYRWSNTILWSSFSHVENADTYKQTDNRSHVADYLYLYTHSHCYIFFVCK